MQRPTPYTAVIIDPMNDPQVQHWAKDLQVETYELRAAIKLIGPRRPASLLREVGSRHMFARQATG